MFCSSQIMAILNITPDSFYQESRFFDPSIAAQRALQMVNEGADILDIGGESTRPFSKPVSVEEELNRVIPVIKLLKQSCSIPLSIDTMKPQVAERAVEAGACLINDVTGFTNPDMRLIAKEAKVDVCVMHMLKNPQTMQDNPRYPQGAVYEISNWLKQQADLLIDSGIEPQKIILDPGIGFGKTVKDNLELLAHVNEYKRWGFRILIGASRKSFLSKLSGRNTEDLLFETLGVSAYCSLCGVDIIRVHDVSAHKRMFGILDAIVKAKS